MKTATFLEIWTILRIFLFCVALCVVALLSGGCATAPGVVTAGDITGKANIIDGTTATEVELLPEGCIQSVIAQSGDEYSYQSKMDPQVVFNDWDQAPEFSWDSGMFFEAAFRNPDRESNIPAAMLLIEVSGATIALSYLRDGEPELYFYDPRSGCYMREELNEKQRLEFRLKLLKIIHAEKI